MLQCSVTYLYSIGICLDSIEKLKFTFENYFLKLDFLDYIGRAALNVFCIQRNDPDFYKEKNEVFGFDIILSLYDECRSAVLWLETHPYYDMFFEKMPLMKKSIHEYLEKYQILIGENKLPYPKIEKWKESAGNISDFEFLFEQGQELDREKKNVTDFQSFLEKRRMDDVDILDFL